MAFVVCSTPMTGEAAIAAGEAVGERGAGLCVDAAELEGEDEEEEREDANDGEGTTVVSSSWN